MSAVLERKPEVFESVNYFDKRRLTNAAKRWVFFALDVIQPERKAELSWLAVGGEESSCPCLMKYGRGFVPRGRAAILEMGGEPIPMRHMGDLSAVAWQGLPSDSHTTSHNFGYVPVYPGDGLRLLKKYSSIGRKGLDELTALEGKEWEECHTPVEDGILDVVELAQFGDGMSRTLRGLEEQIKFAKVNDPRVDYGKLAEEELRLCEDSRNWATRLISIEHGLLKLGHVGEWQGGHSYAYSPVVEMLIEQLELKRQDQPIQEMADMVSQIIAKTTPASGMSAADFDFLMDQKLAKVREADALKIAELEAKLAAATAETFVCVCGNEAKSLAGLKAHQRACEVFNAKEE
jgi:hypothetical protein